jgi:hypothetical protein
MHGWPIGFFIHAKTLNCEHNILRICGFHIDVAIIYWLSRNNFGFGKNKVSCN